MIFLVWLRIRRRLLLLPLLPVSLAFLQADPPEGGVSHYLVGSRVVAKTPRHLGVVVEVMASHEKANVWDWLADSGATAARVFHPDRTQRRRPATEADYAHIATRADFDRFRALLVSDPERQVPWGNYLFSEDQPWLGTPDNIVARLRDVGISPIVSMAYAPDYFPRPLIKGESHAVHPGDDEVDWGAAASAYEYYFASIYRHSSRSDVVYYTLLNEPPADLSFVRQVGVLARLARWALEDVRGKLSNASTASALRLSGPALYLAWEEYWPYLKPYVDFLDLHLYEPDGDLLGRKFARAAMRARESSHKVALTEFNRAGGPLPVEQSLFSIKPSLQFAHLLMAITGSVQPGDPGCEFALAYQFQFPATHRNFKSLVYGDMNLVDWTGADRPADREHPPRWQQSQLRFATPAYHVFRMFARMVPGGRMAADSYDVLEIGEANRGVAAVRDPYNRRNVYHTLETEKYYARGGAGADLRTLAVRGGGRLYLFILNSGPVPVNNVGWDLAALPDNYRTMVVRETSLQRRDVVVAQRAVEGKDFLFDIPPEAALQVILVPEDLRRLSELKIERVAARHRQEADELDMFETARLKAWGKVDEQWMDLTDLNIVWSSSKPGDIRAGSGGLIQRLRESRGEVVISASTLTGVKAPPFSLGRGAAADGFKEKLSP